MQGHSLLNSTRLLYDLQQIHDIARGFSGNLAPDAIARQVTDALVNRFECVFARIWLMQPNRGALRLVASSGLYTHINGAFAEVPVGAFKVGKIAQNRVPFLSNRLSEESWVKDRQWAIDNQIQGFAGYPLATGDRTLGVLAMFSRRPFAPEFLEVLQVLCMTLTVAIDAAQAAEQTAQRMPTGAASLSDQIAARLQSTNLILIGTERPVGAAIAYSLLQSAERLNTIDCNYCRLTYTPANVSLDALVPAAPSSAPSPAPSQHHSAISTDFWHRRHHASRLPENASPENLSQFAALKQLVTYLGGTLRSQPVMEGQAHQILIDLPANAVTGPSVGIQCRSPALTYGFTRLAYQSGLAISVDLDTASVLITDNPALQICPQAVIWIDHSAAPVPEAIAATLSLEATPDQLYDLVIALSQGQPTSDSTAESRLSNRERQVMQLLAQGLRDRNIAQQLFISESTVKFHINNSLSKLNAKNRYQGVYQAAIRGLI
ncbi:MAG: LuxR C-terminal-related transcriptional regulator [Cyanobacteria bacterium P01_C01_bin.73]